MAVLGLASSAHANGRFPRAQRLMQDAEQPERLALYGTYGLTTSIDGGQTWQFVCEEATGPFSGEAPLLELLPEGRIVLSTETGLRVSSFPACDWSGLLEPPLPNAVQDITRDPSDARGLWALVSEPEVSVGYRAAVQRSNDSGDQWGESVRIPSELLAQGLTIDVAPADAQRLYVSGIDVDDQGVLARSSDAGQTWQAWPITGASAEAQPYIAAVASDDSALYVRTDALADHNGSLQPDDALLYSADGGESFTRVLSRRAKLLGFALSPDGETLLLGYGDPVLFAYTVEPEQVGLYRLRLADLLEDPETAAERVEKIFAGSVTCLRWTEQGLFACLAQSEQGFELGRASDAEFSLATKQPFEGLLDLTQLRPLQCAPGNTAGECASDANLAWSMVCAKLGAECSLDGPSEPEKALDDGGCACRSGAERQGAWSLAGLVLWLGALARRRSRAGRRLDTNAL